METRTMRDKTEKLRLPANCRPARLRRGMTLVELLVSMGIIVLIALAFSTILGQSKAVVASTQQLLRANAAASAIAAVIREDFAGLSREGFLAVANGPNYYMVFTATGVFHDPLIPANTANAAVIDYGLDPTTHVLWRRARPLKETNLLNPTLAPVGETIDGFLGLYRSSSITIDAAFVGNYTPAPSLPTPPGYKVSDIPNLWPVLATECMGFKVECWDTANNKWDASPAPFTYANPGNWPKAVKVTFQLRMSDKTTNDTMDYEVICPVRD